MKNTSEKKVPDEAERKKMIDWLYGEMKKISKELNHYTEVCDYYRATKAEAMRDAYLSVLKKLQNT